MGQPKALVFFDLDGTLLNEHSEMEQEVTAALEQLKANGGIPFIATGRSPIEIQHVLDTTPINSFITLNGQYIVYEGKEVFKSTIPRQTLIQLKEVADERDLAVSFYTDEKIRSTRHTDAIIDAYKFIHTNPPAIDTELHLREDILMALLINTNLEDDQYFIDHFPELGFYRNTPFSMDTINKHNSKATGIEELVRLQQFEGIPTFAFGDGPNDIEMLRHADTGVAMGNARDFVKQSADYVTSGHLDGGIVKALQHFELL